MRFRKLFMPVGLVLVICFAMVWPQPGAALDSSLSRSLMVGLIFLISGYRTHPKDLHMDSRRFSALGLGVLVCLIAAPWVAVITARMLALSAEASLGLVVISTVPPTLSSCVVIADNCGGNRVLAMILTVLLNLAGILSIPLLLPLAAGTAASVSAMALFIKLVKLLLLPFAAGLGLRALFRARGEQAAALIYLPMIAIIATVWFTVSGSRDFVLSLPLHTALRLPPVVALVHLVLLAAAWLGSRAIRLNLADTKALTFVASQKTLPVALSVLAGLSLSAEAAGAAVIVCVFYHFFAMIFDSSLAAKWA